MVGAVKKSDLNNRQDASLGMVQIHSNIEDLSKGRGEGKGVVTNPATAPFRFVLYSECFSCKLSLISHGCCPSHD